MKNVNLKVLAILTICLSSQVFADKLSDSNGLFDWAEKIYPQYFNFENQETFEAMGYLARYYQGTDSYLGTKDGRVYVLGDAFGGLVDVGELSYFLNIIDSSVDITFSDDFSFPDGVTGRTYSIALEPETGKAPFSFILKSGSLPEGLKLDDSSGLIQGTPTTRGYSGFSIQVSDANGKTTELNDYIKIYNILSFGEHGTFKGCNGLQMALNSLQDLDEIRIEQGTYECTGLTIATNKKFTYGIKISGGWSSAFTEQENDPTLTVFEGGSKSIPRNFESHNPITGDSEVFFFEDFHACKAINGFFHTGTCFEEEPLGDRILTINSGPVNLEILSFQNAYHPENGAAIDGGGVTNIDHCIFVKNIAGNGGAINNINTVSNSSFTNNSGDVGGAIFRVISVNNSTFTSNRANNGGGAISKVNSVTSSTFLSNIAVNYRSGGGAIGEANSINNSTFKNNWAIVAGGAISGAELITNSLFSNNISNRGGAVSGYRILTINNLFINNTAVSGGAISGYYVDIINNTFANNKASGTGGALNIGGTILNSIFTNNTVGEELNDITPKENENLTVDYTLANYIDGIFDYGTHNIMGDPRFIDAENNDYHLSSDSPAIDIGDSTLLDKYDFSVDSFGSKIDLDGNKRIIGEGVDLGAYEHQ